MSSGFKELKVMKTTQSGFENFIVDEYTTLQVQCLEITFIIFPIV